MSDGSVADRLRFGTVRLRIVVTDIGYRIQSPDRRYERDNADYAVTDRYVAQTVRSDGWISSDTDIRRIRIDRYSVRADGSRR